MTKTFHAIAFAILPLAAVTAQTPEAAGDGAEMQCEMMHNDGAMDHGAMDHGTMDHGTMDHGTMDHGTMDHGTMDHGTMDHGTMDHGTMDHGTMDHGDDAASTPEGHADHGAMMSDEDMQAMHERCAAMHHPSHGS